MIVGEMPLVTPTTPLGSEDPGTGDTPLAAALAYARLGWPVLPLHSIQAAGVCTCSDGADCTNNAGKHPRTTHGNDDATTDEAQIRAWWGRWPDANVGVRTGAVSGLVVLDMDPRNGGEESLNGLQRRHGRLPITVESLTGGGGRHLLFAHPGGHVKGTSGALGSGLDVKADGGYIVAPPSWHRSGRRYAWHPDSGPADVPLAALPAWLLAALGGSAHDPAERDVQAAGLEVTHGAPIPEGQRNVTLMSLAGSMRRRGMTPAAIEAALLAENAARCHPPLPIAEVQHIACSVGRYPPAQDAALRRATEVLEVPLGEKAWPTPPGEAAFRGLAGRLVAEIDRTTEADPVAVLGHFLAEFGVAAGPGPHAMVGATRHPARSFWVFAGKSAKARKGDSRRAVGHVFRLADPEWTGRNVVGGLSTGEGLIWAVRDPLEKDEPVKEHGRVTGTERVVIDRGIEDKRLLVVEPEFARVLKTMDRQGNTLSAVVREAWDSGNLRVMTKSSPAVASGAHVGIVADITTDELRRELNDTEAVNGFANRFLWLLVKRSKLLAEPPAFGGQAVDVLVGELRGALAWARGIGPVERDGGAAELWRAMYPALSADREGLAGSVLARAEAHVLRLSLTYALLDRSPVVTAEHLLAAAELWAYAERSAAHIFGDATGDPVADTIQQALLANGAMARAAIIDLFGRHKPAARIAQALQALQTAGKARCERRETDGRTAEVWRAVR